MGDFGAVFLGADMDGDGRMSRDEISYALDDVNRWWWDPAVNLDADSVLRASEMEGDEGMCYTEFVTACLFSKHSSLEHLAQQAFYAPDVRREGVGLLCAAICRQSPFDVTQSDVLMVGRSLPFSAHHHFLRPGPLSMIATAPCIVGCSKVVIHLR